MFIPLLSIQGDKNLAPPTVLMDHPPLAVYTNAVLSAFNDLRLCAPVALAQDVAMALHYSLETVVQATLAYHRLVNTQMKIVFRVSVLSIESQSRSSFMKSESRFV